MGKTGDNSPKCMTQPHSADTRMLSPTALTQRGLGSCVKASGGLKTGQEHSFSFYFSMVNLLFSGCLLCPAAGRATAHSGQSVQRAPCPQGTLSLP